MGENICQLVSTRFRTRIGEYLLVTPNIGLAGAIVGIMVIFGLDQRFYFGSGSVELQPLFVDGLRYTVRRDSRVT